jgi:hypothetical protein
MPEECGDVVFDEMFINDSLDKVVEVEDVNFDNLSKSEFDNKQW